MKSYRRTFRRSTSGAIVRGNDTDIAGDEALGFATSGRAWSMPTPCSALTDMRLAVASVTQLSITDVRFGRHPDRRTAINLSWSRRRGVASWRLEPLRPGAFAVAIDPVTAVVSVEQYLSLDHPTNRIPTTDPAG